MAYLGRKGASAPVTAADIPDNSITAAKIVEGTITVGDIGTDAVGTDEIANDAVDSQHYAAGSIDGEHIANDVVDSQHYVAGSIDNEHLADDAVGTDELANDVVISTSGAITTTNNSGFTANSGSHGYVTINASATGTASWLSHTKAGSGKWLAGVEGGETDYQLYNTGGSNATRLRVAQAGDVTVTTGNLVIGTAGKGIDFSATNTPAQSSGSGDHNTLDDYEEGSWAPTFGGTISYTGLNNVSHGRYTKIGDMVFCFIEMTIGSWSGAINSNMSLPFTALPYGGTSPSWYSGVTCWTVHTNFTDTNKTLTGWQSGAELVLYKTDPGNSMHHSIMNINTTGRMSYTFSYKTS